MNKNVIAVWTVGIVLVTGIAYFTTHRTPISNSNTGNYTRNDKAPNIYSHHNSIAIIEGRVITKYHNANGNTFIKLSTTDGEYSIPIFRNLGYNTNQITVGSTLKVTGYQKLYNGNPEVVPSNASSIELISDGQGENRTSVSVSNINESMLGKRVLVECKVVRFYEKRENVFLTVTDNNSNLTAVLFRSEGTELSARKGVIYQAYTDGTSIFLDGVVDKYKGELELIIKKAFIK